MDQSQLNWITNFIWNIANDVLRDVYVRGKYRDVILPMIVLRRLDAVLEPTKQKVLNMKDALDRENIANQDDALRAASGQAFYNTSPFLLRDLKSRATQQKLRDDFEAYLDGFSPNVQDILNNFEFRNQIPRLSKADALGQLIEKLLDKDINLSPDPTPTQPGLDNHSMGTIFEELVRRFNEENNEEAGEHWTPRDAVRLMANLMFLPVADRIESGTYLLYDCACGTGGMLTVAEETLQKIAADHGKQVATHLYGQEINAETYAICKADLLLKGDGDAADNIVGGPAHSTLSADAFRSREFDFMLANPPYGKSWRSDLERMGGKKELKDPRFLIEHDGDPEFSLVTRSSDGQMMFLANMLSKMKHDTPLGSRIAEVHNGSSLFTGDAGQGESNIRRWIIENDWLEAIVALPNNMFYNTPMETFVWVLSNRKLNHRRGKVQLIDATQWFRTMTKSMGDKTRELSNDDIKRICDVFLAFEETEHSKIFPNASFGYWKVKVERPLRLHSQLSREAIATLRFASGDEDIRTELYDRLGEVLFENPASVHQKLEKIVNDWGNGDEDEDGEGGGVQKPLPDAKKKKLLNEANWLRDAMLLDVATQLRHELGEGVFTDHNVFRDQVEAALNKLKIKLSAAELKIIIHAVSWREDSATRVIKKLHKSGKVLPDPLRGLFETEGKVKNCMVEYEPDSDLRDYEQVPMLEKGGIEAFICREVLPYTPDAWIDESATKIGYEIPFQRIFFRKVKLAPYAMLQKKRISALEKAASLNSVWATCIQDYSESLEKYRNEEEACQEIGWLGKVPENWKILSARRIFFEVRDKNHPQYKLLSVTQNRGIVYRSELETKVVMPSGGIESYKLVKPGDFVISLRSFQGGLELSQVEGLVSPAYVVFRPRNKILHRYFSYLFKTRHFIAELSSLVSGVRQGKNITWDDFASIQLAVPPLEAQTKIVEQLDSLSAAIETHVIAERALFNEFQTIAGSMLSMQRINENNDKGVDFGEDITDEALYRAGGSEETNE